MPSGRGYLSIHLSIKDEIEIYLSIYMSRIRNVSFYLYIKAREAGRALPAPGASGWDSGREGWVGWWACARARVPSVRERALTILCACVRACVFVRACLCVRVCACVFVPACVRACVCRR